jgi:hypothetical protein
MKAVESAYHQADIRESVTMSLEKGDIEDMQRQTREGDFPDRQ